LKKRSKKLFKLGHAGFTGTAQSEKKVFAPLFLKAATFFKTARGGALAPSRAL
jgi:hypothetical protein